MFIDELNSLIELNQLERSIQSLFNKSDQNFYSAVLAWGKTKFFMFGKSMHN